MCTQITAKYMPEINLLENYCYLMGEIREGQLIIHGVDWSTNLYFLYYGHQGDMMTLFAITLHLRTLRIPSLIVRLP